MAGSLAKIPVSCELLPLLQPGFPGRYTYCPAAVSEEFNEDLIRMDLVRPPDRELVLESMPSLDDEFVDSFTRANAPVREEDCRRFDTHTDLDMLWGGDLGGHACKVDDLLDDGLYTNDLDAAGQEGYTLEHCRLEQGAAPELHQQHQLELVPEQYQPQHQPELALEQYQPQPEPVPEQYQPEPVPELALEPIAPEKHRLEHGDKGKDEVPERVADQGMAPVIDKDKGAVIDKGKKKAVPPPLPYTMPSANGKGAVTGKGKDKVSDKGKGVKRKAGDDAERPSSKRHALEEEVERLKAMLEAERAAREEAEEQVSRLKNKLALRSREGSEEGIQSGTEEQGEKRKANAKNKQGVTAEVRRAQNIARITNHLWASRGKEVALVEAQNPPPISEWNEEITAAIQKARSLSTDSSTESLKRVHNSMERVQKGAQDKLNWIYIMRGKLYLRIDEEIYKPSIGSHKWKDKDDCRNEVLGRLGVQNNGSDAPITNQQAMSYINACLLWQEFPSLRYYGETSILQFSTNIWNFLKKNSALKAQLKAVIGGDERAFQALGGDLGLLKLPSQNVQGLPSSFASGEPSSSSVGANVVEQSDSTGTGGTGEEEPEWSDKDGVPSSDPYPELSDEDELPSSHPDRELSDQHEVPSSPSSPDV